MTLLVCLLLLVCPQAVSQEQQSLDRYYEQAREAIDAENYETAVRIIEEGKQRFPDAAKLNLLLADLYYDKELYKLALEEYLSAGEKEGEDFLSLVQVSRCYGKLNQEQESIATLERILELYPESVSSIDDLGWMYFKTHQLDKGEELLLEALERFGPDRGIYMTLGTLYSGMYDYENSKIFYLKAIEDALTGEDLYFASVAYYNLSLLEHSFYNFNSALRYTEESIQMSDRAPGHLARGELFQSRLEFSRALSEYQLARTKDTTPLSKVNLAMLYQKFGMLELARRYGEEVLGSQDLAWLYYYGTDVERHLKDVHEILADVYSGLARSQRAQPRIGILEFARRIFRTFEYRLKAYYHRQKLWLYSLRVGRSYLQEKNFLDAYWEFYRGNERYKRVALKYLKLARDMEVQVSPHAALYYRQEEGKIRGSRELLRRSIEGLDSFWEQEGIFDSLRYLIPLLKEKSPELRKDLNRLYQLNPGGLLQYGFALPLALSIDSRGDKVLRRTVVFLKKSGSEIASVVDEVVGFRYQLSLERETDDRVLVSLREGEQGRLIFSESFALEQGRSRRQAAALARAVIERIYTVRR
ncbi:MAG: hypothetical protein V3V57_03110 [Spirochaetia bacterium]